MEKGRGTQKNGHLVSYLEVLCPDWGFLFIFVSGADPKLLGAIAAGVMTPTSVAYHQKANGQVPRTISIMLTGVPSTLIYIYIYTHPDETFTRVSCPRKC